VAQGVDPEFKPQYHKTLKKKYLYKKTYEGLFWLTVLEISVHDLLALLLHTMAGENEGRGSLTS
jgi:hypothetical protein